MDVARFSLLPDIFTINSENYSLSQKIRRKISSPVFSICYCLRSTATGFLDFRFCKPALFRHPLCPTFRVPDIVQHVGGHDYGIAPVAVAIFAAWLATWILSY